MVSLNVPSTVYVSLLTLQIGSLDFDPAKFPGTDFANVATEKQLNQMIAELRTLFPILQLEGPNKNASILYTRMCWYSDSVDENFLIDFYPGVDGLLVASGDSGHGFKVCNVLTPSSCPFLVV